MIDGALNIRPGRQRGGERIGRIQLHRALQQFERAGIAVGIESDNTRHRAQREIVCAEAGRRLMQRVIDLGQPQALLKRRSDPDGEVFPVCSFVAQDIVGAMRPELAARFRVDQP